MSGSPLLYGGSDAARTQRLKRQLFRNRVIPGLGILATSGLVLLVTLLTGVWFLFVLTVPLMVLGVLALREAQQVRGMKEFAIYKDGIQLPLPSWLTKGRSFLSFAELSMIRLHEQPRAPYIDLHLKRRRRMGLPHVRLPKDCILEWDRFSEVLHRQCSFHGVDLERS